MQDWPLTVDKILEHAAWHGGARSSRSVEGHRRTSCAIHDGPSG
jgi:hypothetical protein